MGGGDERNDMNDRKQQDEYEDDTGSPCVSFGAMGAVLGAIQKEHPCSERQPVLTDRFACCVAELFYSCVASKFTHCLTNVDDYYANRNSVVAIYGLAGNVEVSERVASMPGA